MSVGTDQLRHPWTARLARPFLQVVAFLLFLCFGAPIWVRGWWRVPRRGGLLVVTNHLSNTDPVIVQYACPRLLNFMARRQLFDMGIGGFMRWWRAFPVTQGSADKGAIKTALELLRAGHAVGLFPEGRLSPDGRLLDVLPGVALIVRKARVPVVCVGLRGTNGVMPNPKETPQWSGRPIVARWGRVQRFADDAGADEIVAWIDSELRRLSGQG
ncbi:MAG: 1-acyl-sn-glycerol-3-phosphate acyltransferase [Fimbriimonadaceae bacterium]|nr:1-acyl-sn-glycerol-3-phosphate acyltransferase [Fimbriimonadaceae bacterium]QYK56407.1 MAG: 1-acyl-sn-glycerol-3-phosphate acyltransferase [Fimbriimonadaceae bacterium]